MWRRHKKVTLIVMTVVRKSGRKRKGNRQEEESTRAARFEQTTTPAASNQNEKTSKHIYQLPFPPTPLVLLWMMHKKHLLTRHLIYVLKPNTTLRQRRKLQEVP